jgi:hypothetical protein
MPNSPSSPGLPVALRDNKDGVLDIPPGNDFIAIAAATTHSLTLKKDGPLVEGGTDEVGLGGEGLLITAPGNNYAAISAGTFHGVASRAAQ